jgi:hypothetical protein
VKWTDLAVKPNFSWPKVQVEIPFERWRVVLQPLTEKLSCTVSVFDDADLTFDEGGTVLSRFLSRLAWSMNGGVIELFICGSNNPTRPGLLGRGNYETSCWAPVEPWDYIYLPSATDVSADLALGIFREGLSVNSVPFSFLSYFKVLNIAFSAGAPQKDWINANIAKIWYQPAVDRIQELKKSESDIGAYLYHQGRCAVAHANGTPLVNPDSYGDKRRLELDLPLMKEVARLFIEQEFGVLSDSTFWKYLRETPANSTELLKKTVAADENIVYAPVDLSDR